MAVKKSSHIIVGILGAVLLLFGILTTSLVNHEFDLLFLGPIHLLLGGALLVLFVFRGGLKSLRSARAAGTRGQSLGRFLYALLFVAVLVVINSIAARKEIFRFDTTAASVYTLAPQTIELVEHLRSPVVMRGFFLGGKVEREVQEMMNRLTKRFPTKLSFIVIDPEKQEGLARKLKINQPGTVHFSFADESSEREARLASKIDEQSIVNAIRRLTQGEEKKVYYVIGHGEPELTSKSPDNYSSMVDAIQEENFTIAELDLSRTGVPADAAALLIASPRRQYLTSEVDALQKYLAKNGNAILLNEPNTTDELAKLAKPFGIDIGNDVVLEDLGSMLGSRLVGFEARITDYGKHPITKDFTKKTTSFSFASSVRKGTVPTGATVVELALTNPQTWAETDLKAAFSENPKSAPDGNEKRGPLSVAAAYEGPAAPDSHVTARQRLVVLDGDLVANNGIRRAFNRDLFLNALNWVVGENTNITLRARTLKGSVKPITAEQFSILFLIGVILIPELFVLSGFYLWWKRRS